MAEEIKVTVDYVGNLKEVVNATKGLNLTEGQSEKVAKHEKGAQLALEAGDLKQFQKHFNALMGIFKDAAAATGQLSSALKTLTDRQADLNKKINELETKKTGLKNQLADDGSGKLNADAAKKFHAESETAKKVKGIDGTEMARDALIKAQEALVKYLEQHNKTLSTLTNADAQAVGFQDRRSAQAANRYVQEETAAGANIQKEVTSTEGEINNLTTEYNQVTTELNSLTTAANQTTEALNALYQKINGIGNQTNNAVTKEINEQSEKETNKRPATGSGLDASKLPDLTPKGMASAFKQFSIYTVAAKALKTAIKEAVKTITELDKYLTEQAMVTGKTREQTYKLVGSYQDLALQCGATTKEVAQVATEYMKQGKTVADSLVLTEAAIKAAKVAGVSVGDSVNYLTTALNGFRLSADQAMAVSDKFAAIAASSATDYDELAIALSKVASQANLAGMSIDYTTALLAKGLETTREAPETMGTALKTIIARMRELSDYGETLGGDTDINKVESQLSYVGIALRDTSGELRSTEDVLDELGHKWDDLNKNQQAAIAKALAGTRQQARLIAMMEDYERVTELQQISARSAGATSAQAATYLEGMAAATNNIKVA
jgi:TP901 family phage tail tape measure protein